MVLLAGLITSGAYVLASLGRNASIPAGIAVFLLFVLGLLVLAHVAVRMLARGADPMILPMAAFLHGLGWVMVARLSARWGGLQATWSFVGIAAFAGTLLLVERVGDLRRH
ncbi:MAG: hypothetical protein RJB57_680, partial [Actinomycetota bacterium]